jgi:hypothetical protein
MKKKIRLTESGLANMIHTILRETELPTNENTEFKEAKGVPIVIRILRAMFDDDVVIRMSIAIFDALKDNTSLVMDIIQFGGLELIDKIKTNYEKDPYISITAPHLLKQVLEIGAKAARKLLMKFTTGEKK